MLHFFFFAIVDMDFCHDKRGVSFLLSINHSWCGTVASISKNQTRLA